MSSTASRTDASGGAAFLEARDGRQRELQRALDRGGAAALLLVGTNIPGPRKHRPGLPRLVQDALAALHTELGLEVLLSGSDVLGPFHLAATQASPAAAKRAAVALENREPSGRLLDLDVYAPGGVQVDRASLGLPPRPCLVCAEPARECILLKRHPQAQILEQADALLSSRPFPRPEAFAAALHRGALRELDLTPKPGLVDRRDNGSHPDLTHAAMAASADLLPRFYDDLIRGQGQPLEDAVRAGRDAETRMFEAIGTNGHRGYIFLSGLVLMAAMDGRGQEALLRPALAAFASRFFGTRPAPDTPGARTCADFGLGGIRAEAERGLPAVFEHGWPCYREALAWGWEPDRAAFRLMAVLMQRLEDTTAVRRCGPEGLARLRKDGESLQRRLEAGEPCVPFLETLNEDYRGHRLTMGGVADCMALTFALDETFYQVGRVQKPSLPPSSVG